MFNKIKRFFIYKKLHRIKENTNFDVKTQDDIKPYIELQNEIDAEKKELKQKRNEIKLPSQSKILLVFLFINFTLLEGFVGYITIKVLITALNMGMLPDFSPLITLISLVVGETISYGIYAAKSKAENTKGGITYETVMKNLESKQNNDGTFG